MLGESHALKSEFPEYKSVIESLLKTDESFTKRCKQYNEIDAQIRKLELQNSPIDDIAMQQLKHQRSALKDSLYQILLAM